MASAKGRCHILHLWVLSLLARGIHCAPQLTLTSQPQTSGTYCPGLVTFTCVGTEIGSLFWFFDGSSVTSHLIRDTDSIPIPLDINPNLDGVTAEITSAITNQDNGYDVTSVLTVSNVSVLIGVSLQCKGPGSDSNQLNIVQVIDSLAPPPSPSISCSLLPSPGGAEVSLQWSPSFTSQYAVERYRVSVNPDPSSCSSEQASFSEDYSCSGLVLGQNYGFAVSAVNCFSQDNNRRSFEFNLQPMVPVTPTLDINIRESEISVQWIVEQSQVTNSELCADTLNYTVVVVDSTGAVMDQRVVTSDSCSDGNCFVIFRSLSPSSVYRISIVVSNMFGSSNTIESICLSRLTAANIGLLAAGVVAFAVAVAVLIVTLLYFVWIIKTLRKIRTDNSAKLRLSFLIFNIFVTILATILWIATAIHVSTETNTCDSEWQSARDGLIISAFVISILVCPAVVASLLIEVYYMFKLKKAQERCSSPVASGIFGTKEPEWVPDEDSNECQICQIPFIEHRIACDGFRRHHCRACGKLVCKRCSKHSVYLLYRKGKGRVCDPCYEKATQTEDVKEE